MTLAQTKQEALQTISRHLSANNLMQANEAAVVYRTLCEAERVSEIRPDDEDFDELIG